MEEALIKYISNITGSENISINEPMKKHTSFKVGGPADILVTPQNPSQISEILKYSKRENIPVFVMGNGTNLVVSDKGIRGIVIKIYDNMNHFDVKENIVEAYSGILMSKVANVAYHNQLTGLEFASGIPGTLGGAVTMNAGAYGGEIKDIVFETTYLDKDGEFKMLRNEEHEFDYRTSLIQKQSGIVVKSSMRLKKGCKDKIKETMMDLSKRRQDKQPLELPSAGSVFKRPEGYFAGKLIEDSGLKGYKIGGAEVSVKHCGFIVNAGGATAKDIMDLVAHIKESVYNKFGVELHPEVRIVGEK